MLSDTSLPQPGRGLRYVGDNAACDNSLCSVCKTCHRFTGKRMARQSAAAFTEDAAAGCDHYWKAKEIGDV